MRSTASVPTQSPRSLEPFTYSSTILPRGSLGAFLTNITLWDRENGPPQRGGALQDPLCQLSITLNEALGKAQTPAKRIYCGLRVSDKE